MNNNLSTIFANPHLRWCGILLAAITIAGVWLPAYKPQFDATARIVMLYAIAAAANSSPQQPKP